MSQSKKLTPNEALIRLQKYCAYQDRCHQEVRNKLFEYQVYGEDQDQVMLALIEEKFLDELRFAKSYVRGKYRLKKWGRVKIKQELKSRDITDYCIRKGLEEIEDDVYQDNLETLVEKKLSSLTGTAFTQKQKTAAFVMRKGYTSEEMWPVIHEVFTRLNPE